MIPFARDVDLLVHEAMLAEGVDALVARVPNGGERLRQHILRSHTTAEDAGRVAAEAGVGRLALNHFVPDGIAGYREEKLAGGGAQNRGWAAFDRFRRADYRPFSRSRRRARCRRTGACSR